MDVENDEGPSNRTYVIIQMFVIFLNFFVFYGLNKIDFFDKDTNLFFVISTSLLLSFALTHNILLMFVPEEEEIPDYSSDSSVR